MAAHQNLSPQFRQLPMFMQAGEIIKGRLGDADDDSMRAKAELLRYKLGQVQADRYQEFDFDEKGVNTPLLLHSSRTTDTTELYNGHHRLAWALNKDPKTELPVEWSY